MALGLGAREAALSAAGCALWGAGLHWGGLLHWCTWLAAVLALWLLAGAAVLASSPRAGTAEP